MATLQSTKRSSGSCDGNDAISQFCDISDEHGILAATNKFISTPEINSLTPSNGNGTESTITDKHRTKSETLKGSGLKLLTAQNNKSNNNELANIVNHTHISIANFTKNKQQKLNKSNNAHFKKRGINIKQTSHKNNKKAILQDKNNKKEPKLIHNKTQQQQTHIDNIYNSKTILNTQKKPTRQLHIENNIASQEIKSSSFDKCKKKKKQKKQNSKTGYYPLSEQELHDDFVMLTSDGGIKKKIIKKSKLTTPPKNSKVFINYTGTLPDSNNKKFDCSRLSFKIGHGHVVRVLDIGVASMKKGEKCILRCVSMYGYGADGKSDLNVPGGAILDYDVELINWDDWQDCDIASGQIKKRILIEIDDEEVECIESDTKVSITYKIYYVDNGVECILAERSKVDLTIDDDRFTKAFHIAIKTMKVGEKSVFKILDNKLLNVDDVYVDDDELKKNKLNHNKRVSPNDKDTLYEIYIHAADPLACMEHFKPNDRIEYGLRVKNKGNKLFKQNRYSAAVKKYQKALEWIDFEFKDDANALQDKKDELLVSVNNNLSAVNIKMSQWSVAIKHATNVLEKEPNNTKALLRRGQAELEDLSFDKSKKDLKKVLSLDKNNSYVKKLLKICNVRQKEYVEKEKKLYAGMFAVKLKNNSKKKNKRVEEKNDEQVEQVTCCIDDKKTPDKQKADDADVMKTTLELKHAPKLSVKKTDFAELKSQYHELWIKQQSKKRLIEQLQNEQNVKDETIKELKAKLKKQEIEYKQEITVRLNNYHEIRYKNVELKRSQQNMQQKYTDLMRKHESTLLRMYKLEKKCVEQQKRFGYKAWDARDVANWIVNLDKRYDKYHSRLVQNVMNECIDGECLGKLDKNDLHRLGIINFRDKFYIYNAIQELMRNGNIHKQKDPEECVVCMDNNRTYACVPCGHVCICESCKDLIDGSCPVCQGLCESFLKIYT